MLGIPISSGGGTPGGTNGQIQINDNGVFGGIDQSTFALAGHNHAGVYEPVIAAGTSGQYWRGDKTWQTLDKSAVGLGNVENTALSTWGGSANITTLGAIATLTGSTSASGTLTLSSTSNATKGKILFGTSAYDEVNNQLGIGTNTPASKIDIKAVVDGTQNYILSFRDTSGNIIGGFTEYGQFKSFGNGAIGAFTAYSGSDVRMLMNSSGGNYYLDLYNASTVLKIHLFTGGTSYFTGGAVAIGLTTVDANYLLQLPNSSTQKAKAYAWDTYSDSRIKLDRVPLNYGLAEVLRLQPKRYKQYDTEVSAENGFVLTDTYTDTFGLVAQEVYEVLPEIVQRGTNETELWGLDYGKLAPVLINAIRELVARVEALETNG